MKAMKIINKYTRDLKVISSVAEQVMEFRGGNVIINQSRGGKEGRGGLCCKRFLATKDRRKYYEIV